MTMSNTSPSATAMTTAILGGGAIGQLICHQLGQVLGDIGLIGRLPGESSRLLTLIDADGNQSQTRVRQLHGEMDRQAMSHLGLLIVCVKAYQVEQALLPLLPLLSKQCHILLLHNGMGPYLAIMEHLDGRGLSLGTTSQAALRQGQYCIRQTGAGLTQLGHCCGPALTPEQQQALLKAIPGSQWCEPIFPALWQKLAVNAAINPLTAIYDCPNGQLAASEYRATIEAIVTELVTVARADGIVLDEAALLERVYRVIELTASNFSSMHQDIHHGRPTEIMAINGYITERAAAHGIQTQVNRQLQEQIRKLEQASLSKPVNGSIPDPE